MKIYYDEIDDRLFLVSNIKIDGKDWHKVRWENRIGIAPKGWANGNLIFIGKL